MSLNFSLLLMALTTLEMDYVNLSPSLKEYFEHLADDAEFSEPIDFFKAVPAELRNNSDLVEKYLNGDPELGISDKDWSHIESEYNGGSNEADNGFFEDMSENRSRGSANTTAEEVFEASEESAEDTETLLQSVEDVAEASVWAEAAEFASGFTEFAFDFAAPLVGGAVVGKKVADHCDTLEQKVGLGAAAGGVTALFLATPLGQLGLGCYITYRVAKRGYKLYNKHFGIEQVSVTVQ